MSNSTTEPMDQDLDDTPLAPGGRTARLSARRSWSFVNQITSLEPGGTACRLYRLPGDMTLEQFEKSIIKLRAGHRSNASTSIRQAEVRTGGKYTCEVCDLETPNGRLYLATIVTRVS